MNPCLIIISILLHFNTLGQSFETDTVQNIMDLYQLSLEELLSVKVTSVTKFEESVKDIPQSIHIITKSDITNYGYRTLAEALQHVPGFYMVDDHYCYKENFGVRGFFRDEWNQNVVFLVNGVRQRNGDSFNNPLSFINVPIQSIERIEIIKGASSVTYGTGAFMGVVNIITTSNHNLTNVYTSYGSQNTVNAGINMNRKVNDLRFTMNSGVGRTDGINQNYKDMGLDTNLNSGAFMHEQYGYLSLSAQSKHISSSLTFDKNTNNRPIASPPYISKVYEQESDFISMRYMLGANYTINKWLETNASYQYQFQQEKFTYDILGLDNDM